MKKKEKDVQVILPKEAKTLIQPSKLDSVEFPIV
jgi:hypothetical protein